MITFEYIQVVTSHSPEATITYSINCEASADEVAEAFFRFLLAVNYSSKTIAAAMANKADEILGIDE